MRRRIFLTLTGAAAAALAFFPASLAWAKKVAIGLDKLSKLKEVGGWTIVKLKGREILFVRDAEDSIRAFDPTCSHKKCPVGYDHGLGKLVCPCHGSTYSLEGEVEIGPAPADLKTYEAKLRDGRIILTLDD